MRLPRRDHVNAAFSDRFSVQHPDGRVLDLVVRTSHRVRPGFVVPLQALGPLNVPGPRRRAPSGWEFAWEVWCGRERIGELRQARDGSFIAGGVRSGSMRAVACRLSGLEMPPMLAEPGFTWAGGMVG